MKLSKPIHIFNKYYNFKFNKQHSLEDISRITGYNLLILKTILAKSFGNINILYLYILPNKKYNFRKVLK